MIAINPIPHLASLPFPDIDPVAFELGPLQVYWYGLSYVFGILFAWRYALMLISDPGLWGDRTTPPGPRDIGDFLTWAVIGVVVGGRLGYALFYDFPTFVENPFSLMEIWRGGMSFHGGLTGIILAVFLFARSRGFSPFSLFDVIAASAPAGIMATRVANFINSELFGKPTTLPWGVIFPNGGPLPRHPSQLYEAMMEGLFMFFILRFLTHKLAGLQKPGYVAGAFVLWYAFSRIMIEFVRLPDPHIGYLAGEWLTMGMVLSAPMAAIGIWLIVTAANKT